MLETILCSVDGSPDSKKAVELTCDLARQYGSRVLIVHGRDVPTVNPNPQATAARVERWETEEEAQKIIEAAVSQLQTAGVQASGHLLPGRGQIGRKILETAEQDGVDLIVLGSRGMSRLEEVMIGSVANKIVRNAKCSVLLAR